jgi:hypothetical protein
MSSVEKTVLAKNQLTHDIVYASLGSFWTQIFADREVLRGYTAGQTEELIQGYYRLIDAVNSLSIKHIPIYNTTKWQPLVIKKSKYARAPFKFFKDGAVFGSQPDSDRFYGKQTFKFGKPKEVSGGVYSYAPEFSLKRFSAISERIVSPKHVLFSGVDVQMDAENVLYFNRDIFSSPDIPKSFVVDDQGNIATFTNAQGEIEEDSFIILWIYHAENDEENIYESFGKIFELYFESSEGYKKLLSSVFDLFIDGPTIFNIKAAMAAFAGVPIVINSKEVVEDLYEDNLNKYVVTDQQVYKFKTYQRFIAGLKVGQIVHAGDVLVDCVNYFDTVISPNWWDTEINSSKLGLSSHIFLGNYKHQLFFKNSTELVSYNESNELVFPVDGTAEDVQEFHRVLNSPGRKEAICSALKLELPGNVAVINPVDFIFKYFLKNCTGLIKLSFNSPEETAQFFDFLPVLRDYLPPHVYILFYINFNIPHESIQYLNSYYRLAKYPGVPLSADGSLSNGMRPYIGSQDSNYYKEYTTRLFCVSESPKAFNSTPLHQDINLDSFYITPSGSGSPGRPRVMEARVLTHVPSTGEVTNREIPSMLIIDFS